jgi:hypothetical protein
MQSVVKTKEINVSYPRKITISGIVGSHGAVHFWEDKTIFPQGIHRCFWITGVDQGGSRGNHAHWKESQVIVAVSGTVEVKVWSVDGAAHLLLLNSPAEGVFIPPLNWVEVKFTSEAVVLGLSDLEFSEEDYIRDKSYFERLKPKLQ